MDNEFEIKGIIYGSVFESGRLDIVFDYVKLN